MVKDILFSEMEKYLKEFGKMVSRVKAKLFIQTGIRMRGNGSQERNMSERGDG
jgi:hypothetical protein